MLEVGQLSLPLDAFSAQTARDVSGKPRVRKAVAAALDVKESQLKSVILLRRSVDARKKSNVHFVATVAVELDASLDESEYLTLENVVLHSPFEPSPIPKPPTTHQRPIVVGAGPAGLFAALYLAEAGLQPIVIEQGEPVEKRLKTITDFNRGADLNPRSNIQFGEGGAGTFSDGKLTTNTKNPFNRQVLQWFYEAGAPEEILWQAKPHLGTDKLPHIVKALRERICSLGGEVRFGTQLIDFETKSGSLWALILQDVQSGSIEEVLADRAVLACGHSARDVYRLLQTKEIHLEQKPFSLGVRIEHPQEMIDRIQYGKSAEHPALGAADYKLVQHLPQGRSVYTFCMCPGGEVVCASSEHEGIVVNGMSRFARDAQNANSAILVSTDPNDFPSADPLAGIQLQYSIEQATYRHSLERGGSPYQAPAQKLGDFLKKEAQTSKEVIPSYARGVVWGDMRACLPHFVTDALASAIPLLDKKLRGFANEQAILTASETRSSSPVRVCRNDRFQAWLKGHSQVPSGIYPCGEGAGYAGGIMSSAADGLRVAQAICQEERR